MSAGSDQHRKSGAGGIDHAYFFWISWATAVGTGS
jgi:hypothetical protein